MSSETTIIPPHSTLLLPPQSHQINHAEWDCPVRFPRFPRRWLSAPAASRERILNDRHERIRLAHTGTCPLFAVSDGTSIEERCLAATHHRWLVPPTNLNDPAALGIESRGCTESCPLPYRRTLLGGRRDRGANVRQDSRIQHRSHRSTRRVVPTRHRAVNLRCRTRVCRRPDVSPIRRDHRNRQRC